MDFVMYRAFLRELSQESLEKLHKESYYLISNDETRRQFFCVSLELALRSKDEPVLSDSSSIATVSNLIDEQFLNHFIKR